MVIAKKVEAMLEEKKAIRDGVWNAKEVEWLNI